jgi:hypothetical protein
LPQEVTLPDGRRIFQSLLKEIFIPANPGFGFPAELEQPAIGYWPPQEESIAGTLPFLLLTGEYSKTRPIYIAS